MGTDTTAPWLNDASAKPERNPGHGWVLVNITLPPSLTNAHFPRFLPKFCVPILTASRPVLQRRGSIDDGSLLIR